MFASGDRVWLCEAKYRGKKSADTCYICTLNRGDCREAQRKFGIPRTPDDDHKLILERELFLYRNICIENKLEVHKYRARDK